MSRPDQERKIFLEGEELTEYDGIYGDIVKTYGRPAAEAFKEVVACGIESKYAASVVYGAQVTEKETGLTLTTEELVVLAKNLSAKRRRIHRD